MAAPTQPTSTTIVTEALRRFKNGGDPTAAEISRAELYGLEKVKRDLMNIGKTWGPLLRIDYISTTAGISKYDNPSDFEGYKEVSLMTGEHTGALSSVVSTSIMDLAIAEDAVTAEVEGKYLYISGGTGKYQSEQILDYTGVRVTLRSAFTTLPVVSDSYLIVNRITPLTKWGNPLFKYIDQAQPGVPLRYAEEENEDNGLIVLNPVPAATYGIRRVYYADLMQLDMALDLYDTILRRWAAVFEQGVYVWALAQDDDRWEKEKNDYEDKLLKLAIHDLNGFVAPQAK